MPKDTANTDFQTKGKIAFEQFKLPAIEAGEYDLTVKQFVANNETSVLSDATQTDDPAPDVLIDQFKTKKSFVVKGERFSLSPDDVQSVFPPEKTTGEYFNVLPHVVLNKPTLPWQRTALKNNFNTNNPDSITGWLALLVFDQFDPEPDMNQGTIADLYIKTEDSPEGKLPSGYISYPFLPHLDYGEKTSDAIKYIDVPIALFNAISPTITDIKWLAHVKKVDVQSKSETQKKNGNTSEATLATVVSNRLPVMGRSSIAHLVSFEKLENYLPDNKGKQNSNVPSGTTHIRLVTLKSWSFVCMKESKIFSSYLKELDVKPFQVTTKDLPPSVKQAIQLGYTALDHSLRDGGNTVSWYHSPLVPMSKKRVVAEPYDSPDSASRYNPSTGMFDVSYATAWQLGNTKSLADPDLSSSIYNWKQGKLKTLVEEKEMELLHDYLIHTPTNSDASKEEKTVEKLVDDMKKTSKKILKSAISTQKKQAVQLPKAPQIPKD